MPDAYTSVQYHVFWPIATRSCGAELLNAEIGRRTGSTGFDQERIAQQIAALHLLKLEEKVTLSAYMLRADRGLWRFEGLSFVIRTRAKDRPELLEIMS